MVDPQDVVMDAIVSVQIRPMDEAIKEFEGALASCRAIRDDFDAKIVEYQKRLTVMRERRDALVASIRSAR